MLQHNCQQFWFYVRYVNLLQWWHWGRCWWKYCHRCWWRWPMLGMLVDMADAEDAGGDGWCWGCWWRWLMLRMLVEMADAGDAGGCAGWSSYVYNFRKSMFHEYFSFCQYVRDIISRCRAFSLVIRRPWVWTLNHRKIYNNFSWLIHLCHRVSL